MPATPALLSQLGACTNCGIDSLRVRIQLQRLDIVNGYGTLAIPGGTYNVLREGRTEYRERRIAVKFSPPIDWYTLAQWTVVDTMKSYRFLSDTTKELVAELNTGSNGSIVQQADYKDNAASGAPADLLGFGLAGVSLADNPVARQTTILLTTPVASHVELALYDAAGRQVESIRSGHVEAGSSAFPWSPKPHAAGVYFLSVRGQGFTVGSRVVLVR